MMAVLPDGHGFDQAVSSLLLQSPSIPPGIPSPLPWVFVNQPALWCAVGSYPLFMDRGPLPTRPAQFLLVYFQ